MFRKYERGSLPQKWMGKIFIRLNKRVVLILITNWQLESLKYWNKTLTKIFNEKKNWFNWVGNRPLPKTSKYLTGMDGLET